MTLYDVTLCSGSQKVVQTPLFLAPLSIYARGELLVWQGSGVCPSVRPSVCPSVCLTSVNFSLKIFSSESTGPILFKFDVNDPWVVVLKVYVFYPPTCIRSQMRLRTVLHRNTMGKNSNVFFSETIGPILFKFDVNDPWVVMLKVYVFLSACVHYEPDKALHCFR